MKDGFNNKNIKYDIEKLKGIFFVQILFKIIFNDIESNKNNIYY